MPKKNSGDSEMYRRKLDQVGIDTELVDDPRLIERAGAWALCLAIREGLEADQAETAEKRTAHHQSAMHWAAISTAAGQQLSGE